MPKHISNPTVLLLDCSIAYQRVEGKLTSLEPLLMQVKIIKRKNSHLYNWDIMTVIVNNTIFYSLNLNKG